MPEELSLIMSMISTVGFPIAACVYMAWYTKYQTDSFNNTIATALTNLKETVSDLKTTIDVLTSVISKEGK